MLSFAPMASTVLKNRATWLLGLLFALGVTLVPLDDCQGQVTVPPEGTLTEEELRTRADAAFRQGDFLTAEGFFLAYERDFEAETNEDIARFVKKCYALIALCRITTGRATEAEEYIAKALQHPELLSREILEELSFWDAIQNFQAGEYREAQESLGKFFQQNDFTYSRRLEALTLFGTCYVIDGYYRTAAEFFANQVPNLRRARGGRIYASRGVVLQMLSLIQSEQYDQALRLLKEEYPNLDQLTQIVSFQTLALTLGSHYMEQEDYYSAIACLQRIWPRERLLRHQRETLSELKERKEALEGNPTAQSVLFQVESEITKVQRELENFVKIGEFDAALRLRLAMAFQGLERYREAALIMEDMLQRMEISPVVESASLAVIQCWSQLERWPKAIEAAENYLQTFGDDPENRNLPQVLFMQADAMMQLQENADAEAVFKRIAASFPEHEIANKAIFMSGFCQLIQDKNDEAIRTFDEVLKKDAMSSLGQDAFYWKGMAYSFSKQYDECFGQMERYLEDYREAGLKYESEAAFRMAYCTFCKADYEGAIAEFRQFLNDYGTTAPDGDEARLLLGDALLGIGEADEGIASYASIDPASTRFFEDGYFKTGKAYKLLEEVEKMRAHYLAFLEKYPESQRMPEAVYWIGWTHVHAGDLDKARDIYWDTIRKHGDTAELFAIEELFTGLPKVYKRMGPAGMGELTRALQGLYIEADREKKTTLAVRALWADGRLKREQDRLDEASALLTRLSTLIDPEIHNPQIVADAADTLAEKGEAEEAARLYRELKKWNPISYHKARAYRGLGMIAEKAGDFDEAIRQFREYEDEAAASTDLSGIVLRRVKLELEQGKTGEAKADLEALLESPVTRTGQKAETLFLIGEILAAEKEFEKATAYYERVYVVYGKFRELVARSYYRRGEALEELGRKTAAFEVYSELASRKDLREFRESTLGSRRAEALEEFAPEEEETPAESSQPGEKQS